MFISDLANSGSLPTLSATMAVAGQRQRLLAHNIANLDTPDFRPMNVDIPAFQRELAAAVERRRESTPGQGSLDIRATRDIEFAPDGRATIKARTPLDSVLYHDRNNRDVERMMQDLAENTMTFRMTTDLIRRENDLLRMAISQRV